MSSNAGIPKKKVRIITLGGTIAMAEDEHGRAAPALDGSALVGQVKGLGDIGVDITIESLSNIPSSHIGIDLMCRLARRIKELADAGEADGFVVIQGTDTQEETAYLLELVLDIPQPVVLTGAMRNSSEPSYDGAINIINACRAAAAECSIGCGVVLYGNDMLHAARDVTKTHTSNVATFQSPFLGPLGVVDKHKVLYFRKALIKEHYPVPESPAEVAVIKAVAGMEGYLLQACIDRKVDGIVIEGLGRGHLPPPAVPAMEAAVKAGIPVILASRCLGGLVLDAYGHPSSASHLKQLGAIFAGDLSGQKARIKLIVVLGTTREYDKIKELFEKDLY